MYFKIITSLLAISLIASIGLAATDSAYIPLVANVGRGIAAISPLLKPNTQSKEDSQE
jgi:hypothetical protein